MSKCGSMSIFSILITDDEVIPHPLPDTVRGNINSFKKFHAGHEHHLFGRASIVELISDQFGQDVLSSFQSLKPYAYQADLARYCLLYHYGGIYADLSYSFVESCALDSARITVFRDFTRSSPWDTCIGLIAAPPRHKAFAKAIELVCANVEKRYYGPTSLCPTGPCLFGKALALTCDPEDLITGESVWTVRRIAGIKVSREAGHHLVSSGRLIAVKGKVGGAPLTQLGVKNGNEYNKLWRARDVYRW